MEETNVTERKGTPLSRFFKFLFRVAVIGTLIMYQVPTLVITILSIPYVLWIILYLSYSVGKWLAATYPNELQELELASPGFISESRDLNLKIEKVL